MRFMMLMIPKVYAGGGVKDFMPEPEMMKNMMKFNESLTKAGVLLGIDGLRPPVEGARVTFSKGKARVIDGPFAEAKELVGGYWLIQVKSQQEAIDWALKCPAQDGDIIEIRQVQEFADFPEEIQKLLQ